MQSWKLSVQTTIKDRHILQAVNEDWHTFPALSKEKKSVNTLWKSKAQYYLLTLLGHFSGFISNS